MADKLVRVRVTTVGFCYLPAVDKFQDEVFDAPEGRARELEAIGHVEIVPPGTPLVNRDDIRKAKHPEAGGRVAREHADAAGGKK